ncbi:HAD-IIB family hydrolase [Spiroplasma endosymbiont of Aspidapion aeneum]|uniref:HAD-IIB family hydrolase n=1 Tax=Spiroplasma endosymbiont of Aspidapion aeneum TaxID=3066276 RepID=UPI00313F00C4
MYKYVASDIDGTILPFYESKLSDMIIKDILEYQRKSGNRFTLCTGRGYQITKEFIDILGIKLPLILNNGATLYDPITKVFFGEDFLPSDMVNKLLKIIANYRNTRWSCTSNMGIYYSVDGDVRDIYEPRNKVEGVYKLHIDDFFEKIKSTSVFQFSGVFFDENAQVKKIVSELEEIGFEVTETLAKHVSIEMYKKGVDKLHGVEKLAKYLGERDLDNFVVFGDNNNDLPMLRGLKNSYVVKNGCEAALLAANKGIIDSVNENGVGKILREMIVNQER